MIPVAESVGSAGNTGYGAFAASGGGTLAYASGTGSLSQLVWLDRRGQRLSTITEPLELSSPDLSPDGYAIALTVGDSPFQSIWLQDITRNVLSRLTSGPRGAFSAIWSPDSRQILLSSWVGSDYRLELNTASGAGSSQVVLEGETLNTTRPTDWSRDGKLVVYSNRSSKTKDDLWLLPDGRRIQAHPVFADGSDRTKCEVLAGRELAGVSDASGQNEVYVQHVLYGLSRATCSYETLKPAVTDRRYSCTGPSGLSAL